MSTKQEEAAANRKRREELFAGNKQQVSHSNDIDFPATSPAAKAQADRIAREKEGAYSKPYPTGSGLQAQVVDTDPAPQTPEEFDATGGVKVTDNAKEAEAKSSGTTEVAPEDQKDATSKASAKADEKTTDSKVASTPKK
jgi:hypothetical protein